MGGGGVEGSIVAGVDGSAAALRAARWAADEAARRRLPLRLVRIVTVTELVGGFTPPADFYRELESEGERELAEAQEEVRRARPGLDVGGVLRTTPLIPTLIDISEEARLMVLGSRGTGGFRELLTGSTAIALAAHGHCPVVVVRDTGAEPPTTGPVVVGVDGSPVSEPALAVAFDEAASRGAELVAVHVWAEYASDIAYAAARQFLVDWSAAETREDEVLAERIAGRQEKYPDVPIRRVIADGRPASRLLDEAAGAQLLVVGSRGRGGFAGMLLGSTSRALIHHASCPVMVVRPAGD